MILLAEPSSTFISPNQWEIQGLCVRIVPEKCNSEYGEKNITLNLIKWLRNMQIFEVFAPNVIIEMYIYDLVGYIS